MQETRIYSGASPQGVAADLAPLVDLQEEGLSLGALRGLIEERLLPHLLRYDRPEFQSMFNAFPEEGAALGAGIALAYNQGVTSWQVSPGGATLEELCCRALCRLFDLDSTADATFMYSGTYANQEALYLALHWKAEQVGFDLAAEGLGGFGDPGRLAVLTSGDAHFSIKQAVRMLGLGERCLVSLPVDANRRIDVARLREALAGLPDREVFCIVATAGTTSTGSVDPIVPLAGICAEIGAWLHVDGAYGLAYRLVPEWAALFAGVEGADSVSWDPHKQMAIPIPSSILFVRRWEDFQRMALHSDYIHRQEDVGPQPGLKSPPSTRPLSALPLVASLRHQGLGGVRRRLRAPLVAIRTAAEALRGEPDIEPIHRPDTGVLCFRVLREGLTEERLDQLQEWVYNRALAEGRRSISMTRLDGRPVLRLVAISPAVTAEALLQTVLYVRELTGGFVPKS